MHHPHSPTVPHHARRRSPLAGGPRADRTAQPPSSRPAPHGEQLAAQSGASLRDLMARMGHDSPAAALIYQHSSRVADEAIAAALDARLTERKSRPAPDVVGPVEGPTEPQLIAVEPRRSGKMASDQG